MKGLRWEIAGWKKVGVVQLKESLVCLGSMRILERAMVVAAMAALMYPLLFAASSNATAAADFTPFFGATSHRGHRRTDAGQTIFALMPRGGTTREDSD